MLTSLALIILTGLFTASICQKLNLPRIIGFLLTGIILGPNLLNLLDSSILLISSDLRKIALIIILLKAGFSLDLSDLKKLGRSAVMMSFIPALFEIISFFIFAPILLQITHIEALVMGSVLAAVSPAVVVPKMVYLIENKYGTEKSIPQLILAGTSCDDIFVVVLFSTFINMAQGGTAQITDLVNIPISIILGVIMGIFSGLVLSEFFEKAYIKKHYIRNSMKIIIILGVSFLLMSIELWLENTISISGLLAIVSLACTLKLKSTNFVSKRLSEKCGKLWLAAEVILFVLVGAAVDISYMKEAGIISIALIFTALIFRTFGVLLCMLGTPLNAKERLFCVIAYLPKATVQAAIGSVPLSLGLPCGNIVLSVAVIGILITAPLGAIGMDISYKHLL